MTPSDGASPVRDVSKVPFKPLPMKGPDVSVDYRPDGSLVITSNHAPGEGPRSIAHLLAQKAGEHPDRPYLKQREPGHGPWRGVTYGQALRAVEGIAQWLLDQGLTSDDSVMILSGNSIEHALMTLGAYMAGVPAAPVSPAYSLISTDHAKLKHCFDKVAPRVVFAQSGTLFAKALETLRTIDPTVLVVTADGTGDGAVSFDDIAATVPTLAVEASRETLGPATVAKYLFTSGSTGMPKAVAQTHGMMAGVIAGQDGLKLDEPDDGEVSQGLEWMPWSHISAGNISFNGLLWAGGTLHIDEGKPLPGMFETTIKNLYEVSPIVFGSAPIAFGMLADAMEKDPALRRSFFKNLRYMGYGGATLSSDVSERMQALAIAETGHRIPLTTMYGATETQGITVVHWITERVGLVGLPLPGIELKLVPNGSKLEVRVKGPTVTSGYHNDPEKTAAAFDEEGFYKLGDAARFVDPEDPAKGMAYDGRLSENFKLASGTFVGVGELRIAAIGAVGDAVTDAVVCGEGRESVGLLLYPNPHLPPEAVAEAVRAGLERHNAAAKGSGGRIARALVLPTPPDAGAGEITDKGYIAQSLARTLRAAELARLFAEPAPTDVMVF